MATLLQISGLSVDYATAGETVRALRGIDLEVSEGETVGILGESGSGKSSLALSLLGLLPQNASVISGAIGWRGRDLLKLSGSELRRVRGAEISLVFQEPALSLNPVLTAGRQIEDVLTAHRAVSRMECSREISSVLAMAGFQHPERTAQAYPHELSGGERQRVALAQAIVCRPSLLVADEPLSALDLVTQAEVLALLRRLQRELGLALLLITHNPGVLEAMSARAVTLHDGEIVAEGTLSQLRLIRDPYVQKVIFPARELSAAQRPVAEESAPALIEVIDLSKNFSRKRMLSRRRFDVQALQDVNFTLARNSTTALVGRSGSGKSTLARCLAGFETPTAGRMTLEGAPLRPVASGSAHPAQMVFQDASTSLNPWMTAAELIGEPLEIMRWSTAAARDQKAGSLMEESGLDRRWLTRRAREFSGGQRQRLAIARALAVQPRLLILDEAFSGLDLALQAQMLRLIMQLQAGHGFTSLYISHDLNFVSMFAQKVMVMQAGRLVENVAAGKMAESRHSECQALVAAAKSLSLTEMGAQA